MAILAGQIIRAADLSPTEWQPLVLQNGWTSYGGGWSDPMFRKHPLDNTVEVKGVITGGTFADKTIVFSLPEGFRPTNHVAVSSQNAPVTGGGGFVTFRFINTGNVELWGATSSGQRLALDTIRFSLD